jgi:hypothetical protein
MMCESIGIIGEIGAGGLMTSPGVTHRKTVELLREERRKVWREACKPGRCGHSSASCSGLLGVGKDVPRQKRLRRKGGKRYAMRDLVKSKRFCARRELLEEVRSSRRTLFSERYSRDFRKHKLLY